MYEQQVLDQHSHPSTTNNLQLHTVRHLYERCVPKSFVITWRSRSFSSAAGCSFLADSKRAKTLCRNWSTNLFKRLLRLVGLDCNLFAGM